MRHLRDIRRGVTDGRTDGRTDGQTDGRTLLWRCDDATKGTQWAMQWFDVGSPPQMRRVDTKAWDCAIRS